MPARATLAASLCLPLGLAMAQDELPDIRPAPVPSGQDEMEPEVTIQQRGEEVVEEYRINGQLYMVRITPAKGPAYYLIDTDGDGELESRRGGLDPQLLVPHWTILRW